MHKTKSMKAEINNENKAKIYTIADPGSGSVVYVGKTKRSIKTRLTAHRNGRDSRVKSYLIGLKELGIEPLIEVVHLCGEHEDWQVLEKHYISNYRALYPDLLNVCSGGLGAPGSKRSSKEVSRIIEMNRKRVYYKIQGNDTVMECESVTKLANDLGVRQSSISNAIKRNGSVAGYLFSYDGKFNQTERSKKYRAGWVKLI